MDMILKFNNKYKRITISLMVILLLFTFTVPNYKAEGAVVSLTAGALYFIYACSLAGVHMSMDSAIDSYAEFKATGGEDYESFNISLKEFQTETQRLHDESVLTEALDRQAEIGEKVVSTVQLGLENIWTSVDSWLNTNKVFNNTGRTEIVVGNMEFKRSRKSFTAYRDGVSICSISTSDLEYGTISTYFQELGQLIIIMNIDKNSVYEPPYDMYFTYDFITGDFSRVYDLDLTPFMNRDPGVALPENGLVGNGTLDVPLPYFPDSFVPDVSNPGDVVFDPSAPVTIPSSGIANPTTGNVAYPGTWSGDWVSGIPYPGVSVPSDWTGDFPLDVPVDTTVPGDGTDTGENTGDPTYPVPVPGDIDFTPIMQVGNGIKDKFPFSLPWDFMRVVGSIASDPVAPNWELPLNVPGFKDESMTIDFSKFDKLALISRFFTTIIFIGALILATRKLISG